MALIRRRSMKNATMVMPNPSTARSNARKSRADRHGGVPGEPRQGVADRRPDRRHRAGPEEDHDRSFEPPGVDPAGGSPEHRRWGQDSEQEGFDGEEGDEGEHRRDDDLRA